jgi:Ca-activated chloride channel homolog
MNQNKPKIELYTEKSKLAADKQQTINALIRISPPQIAENKFKRPKLNLSIVLDRSGSMQGVKMRQAKQAAKYCIDQLLPADRISAVIFDDVVEVLIPGQNVENKEPLKERIDGVYERGSTALHEAWVKGGWEVSRELNPEAINRVLLITDGLANVGETNTDRIVSQAQQLFARGVSTSTVGIGEDFNEDLLMPMADAAGGNAWHVERAADMTRIFSVELEGLIAQIGRDAALEIKPAAGVSVADVLNDFEPHESGRYKLPNLQAGNTLDIVVQLRIPAQKTGEKVKLAEIELTFIGQESNLPEVIAVSFEIEFDSARTVESLPENREVTGAVQLLMNARARREAIDRMDRNDYSGARQALYSRISACSLHFEAAPNLEMEAELNELRELDNALDDRNKDKMTRKQMAYNSWKRRMGK